MTGCVTFTGGEAAALLYVVEMCKNVNFCGINTVAAHETGEDNSKCGL